MDVTPEQYFQQALACHQNGKLAEAKAAYLWCLARNPKHPYALMNLGSLYRKLGETALAIDYLRQAVALVPQDFAAHYNLGNSLLDAGDSAEAAVSYRSALSLAPSDAATWYNLAIALRNLKDTEGERDAYRRAIAANPEHFDARLNLAESFSAAGEGTAAERELLALLERMPTYASALNNLAQLQQDTGRQMEALQTLGRVMALAPDLAEARSNFLMSMQYHPTATSAELLHHACEWGEWASERAAGQDLSKPFLHDLDVGHGVPDLRLRKALRVGYVSADLCTHPVGLFLKGVIASHDPAVVTPVVYSSGSAHDQVFAAIVDAAQAKGGCCREVKDLDDATLAARIRADGINILVDLSGHTGQSRLAAFAWKPAPVQISWLGYFATTGLPEMDFVILDPYHAPPGAEAQFSERIIRLPHNRFCYQPVPFAPDVSPPPFQKNGYITFGSFNNTAKLNETVLSTWAIILKAVPGSRLILKWRTFADALFRKRIADFFVAQGVAAERIELRPVSTHRQLLEEYADIDIALDPFPFSGGHTSCEALWMGVPVVTLPQERVVSRQTWSFLNNIGLPGLAAADVPGYVQLAVSLANSPGTLLDLRQNLRDRVRASPLCDVAGFTRLLEEAYCVAWHGVTGNTPALPARAEQTLSPVARAEQLHQYAIKAWQQGDAIGAKQHLEAAIAFNSDVAAYHANLGVMLKQLGAGEERIACYQRAIELAPDEALYHGNLAGALNEVKRHSEGEAAARRAIALAPDSAAYWFNLGGSLSGQARWAEAAAAFDAAAGRRGNWAEALKAAGEAWRMVGNWGEASRRFHDAWQSLPADAPLADRVALLRGNGEAQQQLYCFSGAEKYFREALELKPDDVELLTDLGNVFKVQARFDEARLLYRRVVELRPELAGGHCNLGTVDQSIGDYAEAVAHYRRALDLAPQLREAWSNLGMCLTYSPAHGAEDVLAAFRGFDAQIAQPLFDPCPHTNDRNPERRLRVCYVSPDYASHD